MVATGTTQEFEPYTKKWLEHIRILAVEIGPRASTTEGERLGSQYCLEALEKLGLSPKMESFTSARSIF